MSTLNAALITEAIETMNTLIEVISDKDADIDASVEAAINAIPKLDRAYWVDQVNGSDADVGSEISPFQSIQAAIDATPRGGLLQVNLVGAYAFDGFVFLRGRQLYVRGVDGTNPAITPALEHGDPEGWNADEFSPGFFSDGEVGMNFVRFQSVTINLPDGASTLPATRRGIVHAANHCLVRLHRCTVNVAATSGSALMSRSGVDNLIITEGTLSPDMGGHYVSGIAAGTDPATLAAFATNVAQL